MNEIQTLITIASSIFSWVLGKKFLLPHIVNAWEWFTNKKKEAKQDSIDAVSEILKVKEKDVDLYESQIRFLNEQIKSLQEYLTMKEEELDKHYKSQDSLKDEVMELSKKVYLNERRIQILQDNACFRYDCKMRISTREH